MHDPDVLVWGNKLVDVWHHEPGGADSCTVCAPGSWWRHPRHWRINVVLVLRARRRLLTRCTWCGGASVKGNPVNCSRGHDSAADVRWWQPEIGLYHSKCLSVRNAFATCMCANPTLEHGEYGLCSWCGHWRRFGWTAGELLRAGKLQTEWLASR